MAIPPPPPGFTLNAAPPPAAEGAIPPPPSGFTLNASTPPAAAPRAAPPVSGVQHAKDVLHYFTGHPLTAGVGMLENLASGVTGGLGAVADAVTGADPGAHDWAYQPRTVAGQEAAGLQGQEMVNVGRIYDKVAGTGPLAETLKERLPQAAAAVSTLAPMVKIAGGGLAKVGAMRAARAAPITAEQVVSRMGAQQSTSAAAAAPSLTNVSPELRQAITRTAQKTGGAVNTEVLERHIEAESLPRPVRLTEGQATQDPVALSHEQNLRGKHRQLAEHFNEQNKQLVENVQAIRDEVGPDVFSANPVEHGDTLIAAYQAKNAAAQKVISGQYQALQQANGGKFPVDAKALLGNASAQLHQGLLFDHAPKAIMSTLTRLATKGGMTFENYESLRTNLARIQRSITADGNEKAAAGVIREAMEQLPLAPEAASLKPLADQARASARAQFQAVDADPAYKAAVNETVPPDRFVSRFVIGAPRDAATLMQQNLAHDPAATQTMGVAALDHLRQAARIDADGNGNFSQAGYNKALQSLSPKLRALVPAKTAEQLESLGNVARYTQFQPRGSFVNNSNTTVSALASESAKSAAEGATNVAFAGIPVGTWGRKIAQHVATGRKAQQATAPGAGLGRLKPAATPPSPKPVSSNKLNVGAAQARRPRPPHFPTS